MDQTYYNYNDGIQFFKEHQMYLILVLFDFFEYSFIDFNKHESNQKYNYCGHYHCDIVPRTIKLIEQFPHFDFLHINNMMNRI